MECKHHRDRQAEHFCVNCNAPLCSECVEEVRPGVYACFQCAMLQSVTQVGSTIIDKKERAEEKKSRKKKAWGPYRYFLVVSSVLILAMWGVIIFGGRPAPEQTADTIDRAKGGRVLLFLVNGSINRYAHYEGNRYPESLEELVPRYLQLKKNQLSFLDNLQYSRDPDPGVGYRLSLAHLRKGEMRIILTAGGVRSMLPGGEGS
jgi:hypothetical protein